MDGFPVFGRNHLNSIPGAAVEKRAIRTFAGAFLTTNAEVWIDLYPAKGRMIMISDPKHAAFDGAVLDTGRRARTASAAISGDGQDSWLLFSSRLAVANRHGPLFFNNVVQATAPAKPIFQ